MAVVSLKPSTFVESGLLDDADVKITDAAFCIWNYGGKGPDSLALGVEFHELVAQADGTFKKHEQFYSAGDMNYFRPSQNGGATLEPISDRTAMNGNTNAAQFIASLVKAGFPESQFESGSCKVIIGLSVHVNRVAQPKRQGLKRAEGERESTVLLVSRILGQTVVQGPGNPSMQPAVPPSNPFGGGTQFNPPPQQPPMSPAMQQPFSPAPVANVAVPSNGAAVSASTEVQSAAYGVLINILASKGGNVMKKDLPGEAFRAMMGNKDQSAVVSLIFDDKFLSSVPGVQYDGATVRMG